MYDSVFFLYILLIFFFFQAEDGIRDAQESRGLGDVYKRQALHRYLTTTTAPTNKSHTTFTTIPATTIYDSNSGLPKQMYGAAIDVLSSNGLASERYCVASVHDRLQQLRLAVGCIIPVSYTHLTLPTKRIV
eukprot:TRINITY_DN10819_c0_g1_i2.p1 TRINITY_DN10819_c0_g1~~TRINITY_DN10819_c0_g1_i2.p1  ORF type:complete len:132 (-),score=30.14 TRINITY_DN10819_c0_g1_i2:70-465(-)